MINWWNDDNGGLLRKDGVRLKANGSGVPNDWVVAYDDKILGRIPDCTIQKARETADEKWPMAGWIKW